MKKYYNLLLLGVALIFMHHLIIAQTQAIIVDTTITTDYEFYPFSSISTIQGLGFSGSVTLNSDSSLVRLIYIDGNNKEWLLMEAYPMITNDYTVNYFNFSDETRYLDNNPTSSILVEIIDANINIDTLICSTVHVMNTGLLNEQAKYNNDIAKADAINTYNKLHNLRWVVDYNDIVGKWYFDKKRMFGDKYNTLGFEYYHGGIFETVFTQTPNIQTNLVPYFDWRSRHNANVEGTPYYDGNEDYATGWISPTKSQGVCGSCWAFSTTATVEAVSNLYYNISNLNPDLAEQELISCLYDDNCQDGGYPTSAFQYIIDNGIDNEDCFPYDPLNADNIDCGDPSHCQIPDYHTTIENYDNVNDDDIDNILIKLITKGPLQITHYFPGQGSHGMSLIGYSYIDQNSEILWLVENSWGTTWGDHGVGWVKRRYQDLNPKAVITPVTIVNYNPDDSPARQWYDRDGDGVYWWGIGEKPADCLGNAYNEDCNDDDPALGGYDENYNCKCLMPYRFDPLVINNNTIWWGDDQLIDCDIEIESGATLTIHNIVKMTDNARIIVKRGAKLIVDGGTITNLCTNRWKGIEVWGTSNLPQDESGAQGVVELKNDAVIENAVTAIETVKRSNANYVTQTYYREYSGGIVTINDATIKNCVTGVRFWTYPYGSNYDYATLQQTENLSTIKNTRFIVDEDFLSFPTTALFNSMIYLDGINGLSLESVIFENDQQSFYDFDKRGYGIYANNSTFNLSKDTNDNIIDNFNYGIYSISSGYLNGFTSIHETVFNNNKTAVYISYPDNGANPVEILFNEFNTPSGGSVNDKYTGLYLNNTSSFIVEENSFTGDISTFNTPAVTYGIVVNNCGENDNTLFNNTLNGFDKGIQAQDINRGQDGSGLQIKCNDYTHCEYDTRVLGHTPVLPEYGIADNQGSGGNDTKDPAGNTFTYKNTPSYNDIFNNTNKLTYWYHYHDGGFNIKPESYSEDLVFPNTDENQGFQYSKSGSCPSHYTQQNSFDETASRSLLSSSQAVCDTLQNQLNILIDGGNTDSLTYAVQNSTPAGLMIIRQKLLSASPYLSDTVLLSVAYKENVIANAILTEIFVANPQSTKSNKILSAIDQRDTLLTQNQYNQITAGKLIAGAKEILESELAAAYGQKEFATKNLFTSWYRDSVPDVTDSIINILQNSNELGAKYALMDKYLSLRDTISAKTVYQSIDNNFDLNSTQYNYWLNYNSWLNYRTEQIKNEKYVGDPDSLQLTSLYNLYYNADNMLKAKIRNLLLFADTLSYDEPYLTADTTSKSAKVVWRPVGKTTAIDKPLVYPNPANGYVIIDYSGLNAGDQLPLIKIRNGSGIVVQSYLVQNNLGFKVIDTHTWKPGVYTVSITGNGKLYGTSKIVVLH